MRILEAIKMELQESYEEGYKKGNEEGYKKGYEEGMQKTKFRTAKYMKRLGVNSFILEAVLDFSLTEIESM